MPTALIWLDAGEEFPPVTQTWREDDPVPGLLAAGGVLDVQTLSRAYRQGIFPWFSEGQPPLWWSPDPRMVLTTASFRLHRSLKKTLVQFQGNAECEIRFDSAFARVIEACAMTQRRGQPGTWIVPAMMEAYTGLHRAGLAHSVETWVGGELVGGLYCVALGKAVFGESMFAHQTDASKIALASLVAFCRANGIEMIDCQQNTPHLASLGAAEMPRSVFLRHVQQASGLAPPAWKFNPLYWGNLLSK